MKNCFIPFLKVIRTWFFGSIENLISLLMKSTWQFGYCCQMMDYGFGLFEISLNWLDSQIQNSSDKDKITI